MLDGPEDLSGVLKHWLTDYLSWMAQSGYALSTIDIHERMLGHFQKFIKDRNLCRKELFTYDTLKAFEKHCRLLYASWTLRGLTRYLAQRSIIPAAITKPCARLPGIYEEYLRFFEENRQVARATLMVARKILAALNDYLTERDIELKGLHIEHIDDFLGRYNAGLKPATCHNNRSYLRGFLRYLYHSRNMLGTNLSPLVIGAANFAHSNPPKFLRPEEIKKLFAVPKTYTSWELRGLAMVHLAYALGLRPKEISLLCLDDICFGKAQIRIAERKSLNPVMLPLPEAAIKAIAAYVVGARPKTESRRLFLTLFVPYRPVTAATVSHDITTFIQKINPSATGYFLRHTYAQHLLESNASIFEVKQMLGHDCLQSTRRYLHIHTGLMRKVLFDESL
jgi:site-specific recombinase XerD